MLQYLRHADFDFLSTVAALLFIIAGALWLMRWRRPRPAASASPLNVLLPR